MLQCWCQSPCLVQSVWQTTCTDVKSETNSSQLLVSSVASQSEPMFLWQGSSTFNLIRLLLFYVEKMARKLEFPERHTLSIIYPLFLCSSHLNSTSFNILNKQLHNQKMLSCFLSKLDKSKLFLYVSSLNSSVVLIGDCTPLPKNNEQILVAKGQCYSIIMDMLLIRSDRYSINQSINQ